MLSDLLVIAMCVGAVVFCVYMVQSLIHDSKNPPKYQEPNDPRDHDRDPWNREG